MNDNTLSPFSSLPNRPRYSIAQPRFRVSEACNGLGRNPSLAAFYYSKERVQRPLRIY
jgi:hypothetical protein